MVWHGRHKYNWSGVDTCRSSARLYSHTHIWNHPLTLRKRHNLGLPLSMGDGQAGIWKLGKRLSLLISSLPHYPLAFAHSHPHPIPPPSPSHPISIPPPSSSLPAILRSLSVCTHRSLLPARTRTSLRSLQSFLHIFPVRWCGA